MSGRRNSENNHSANNNRPPPRKGFPLLTFAALGLGAALVFNAVSGGNQASGPVDRPYSQFLNDLENDRVSSVTLQEGMPRTIRGQLSTGEQFRTYAPYGESLLEKLEESGVTYSVNAPPPPPNFFQAILPHLIFPAIFIGFLWFMSKRSMGGGAMGFGKSKTKLLTEHEGKVTFDDVAGIEEAKQDLQELVDFLRDPGKFQKLGGKMPTGVLMVGPPGTGKTLTARAVAGEAGVPFFTTSGSEFVEMFVGVGASRVRDMFEQAKRNAPCIIFIDEIDAVGRHRGAGVGGGNDEREQTLNQLLVEMDGFESNQGIIIIAATNRPDVLDPALLRPGRFDRQVVIGLPDLSGRDKILKVHLRKVPVAGDVDSMAIARGTPGFSGADLANLVNEAALLAARRNREEVTMADFEQAKDKIMMGPERRSLSMSDQERKLTAYHEAGHALVSYFEPGCDPIHKATIVPRGRALGMVISLPERDRVSISKSQLMSMLAMAYGGRVAEELTFGPDSITTGASGDIQQATKMARAMVTQYGFSDKLGRVQYEGNEQEVFLGHSVSQKKNISEATAQLIDEEVKRLTDDAEARARKVITDNREAFVRLAETLLKYETLTGDEVGKIIRGEPLDRKPEETPPEPRAITSVPIVPRIPPAP